MAAQFMLRIPPTKIFISYPLESKRVAQISLPFGKWRFMEVGRIGPNAEKDKTEHEEDFAEEQKM